MQRHGFFADRRAAQEPTGLPLVTLQVQTCPLVQVTWLLSSGKGRRTVCGKGSLRLERHQHGASPCRGCCHEEASEDGGRCGLARGLGHGRGPRPRHTLLASVRLPPISLSGARIWEMKRGSDGLGCHHACIAVIRGQPLKRSRIKTLRFKRSGASTQACRPRLYNNPGSVVYSICGHGVVHQVISAFA